MTFYGTAWPPNEPDSWPTIVEIMQASPFPAMEVTSTQRPLTQPADYHMYGMAADFARPMDDAGQGMMRDFANWLYQYADWFLELIHTTPYTTDNGYYVKNGQIVNPGFYGPDIVAQHINHVHVAMSYRGATELLAVVKASHAPVQAAPAVSAAQPTGAQPVTVFGIDCTSIPSIDAMHAANVKFVCRYLSFVNSQTSYKILSNSEAKLLSQNGIAIVSNYEWTGTPDNTIAAGVQDATIAVQQHTAAGGPADRPIYFSIDEDVLWTDVNIYFQGIARVLPLGRIGAYGEAGLLKDLRANGLISWQWQTYAWSGGIWDPNNHIEQYSNDQTIGGTSVDFNRGMTADYGQWFQTGFAPPAGVGSASTTSGGSALPVNPALGANDYSPYQFPTPVVDRPIAVMIADLWNQERAETSPYQLNSPTPRTARLIKIDTTLAALTAAVAALEAKVDALSTGGVDATALADAVVAGVAKKLSS